MPKVNQEICTGCGACITSCPVEAISMNDENKAEINQEACTQCGACIASCPMGAIEEN